MTNPPTIFSDNQSNQKKVNSFPSGFLFWFFGFLYASLLALMFQKLILPELPALHAGNGLLHNDAVVFHDLAVNAAEKIRLYGWSAWQLFPGATGNVGLLSAVYAVWGPEPACFIPFNAAAHATGALLIYLIGQKLWPGKTGRLGGLIAGILFLTFPSALQWYGQNHKDAFSIAGILLMLYAWLSAIDSKQLQQMIKPGIYMISGAVLLSIVRPYYPLLIILSFSVSWFSLFATSLTRRSLRNDYFALLAAIALLIMVVTVYALFSKYRPALGAYDEANVSHFASELKKQTWAASRYLPASVDHKLERVAIIRAHFILYSKSVGAGSSIDDHIVPYNAASMLTYLPRALFVGLFAPFPDTWTERVSAPRLVGAVETLIWYVVASGAFILFVKQPSRKIMAGLVFVCCLLTILAYVHPNVGTLYRQRYGIWFFVLLCGATGWAHAILSALKSADKLTTGLHADTVLFNTHKDRKEKLETVAASGAIVLIITFCCFLGFMARDLLLVRMYGMSTNLDVFFTASMVPMFFVTFLSMPIPDAFTSLFLKSVSIKSKRLPIEQGVLFILVIILSGCMLFTALASSPIMELMLGTSETAPIKNGAFFLSIFSALMILSAWTIIGNSILNSLHYSKQAALAQLVVPILAIASILVAPSGYGLHAAAFGMVIGTMFNAVLVYFMTKKCGFNLWPQKLICNSVNEVFISYKWLSIAAFFTAIVVPINFYFANSLDNGTAASWSLASKIVSLFNGLSSVGITAVVLPHLAKWATKGNLKDLANDVYFLLLSGTWIGLLLSVIIFLFSEPLVYTMLKGGNVTDAQINKLSEIVKIGTLQLPMIVSSTVIIKISAVTNQVKKTVIAAIGLFIINLLGNLILVPKYGIYGIALSSVTSTAVSASLLIILEQESKLIKPSELLLIILSWFVLAGIGISFHYGNLNAGFAIMVGLATLGFIHWQSWNTRSREFEIKPLE